MAAPTFIAAGDGIAAQAADIAVAYMGSLVADDLLIIHQTAEDGADVANTVPSGWTEIYDDFASGINSYVLARKSDGTETGTVTLTLPVGAGIHSARMYQFRGWLQDATWANNFEGAGTGEGIDETIEQPSITTTDVDRLCVALVAVIDDNALDAFTGMTGGTWAEPVAEFTTALGNDHAIGIQTATLAAAGTISGGVDTMAVADAWFVRTFAIKPAGGAPANKRRYTLTTQGVG